MIVETFLLTLIDGLSMTGRLFNGDTSEVGRQAINNGSGLHAEDALVIVGGLLTLLSGISLLGWLRKQKLRPHTLVVFNRVAREAGLGWGDRRLLWKLSRESAMPTPLALMLCPGTLGHAARHYARNVSPRRGLQDLTHAASIRRHLFGA